MGWSCRADAAKTLDKFTAACVQSTGNSNGFEADGERYFFEVDDFEHEAPYDGAISGEIYRHINDTQCVKAGSFFIEGDGRIKWCASEFLTEAAS